MIIDYDSQYDQTEYKNYFFCLTKKKNWSKILPLDLRNSMQIFLVEISLRWLFSLFSVAIPFEVFTLKFQVGTSNTLGYASWCAEVTHWIEGWIGGWIEGLNRRLNRRLNQHPVQQPPNVWAAECDTFVLILFLLLIYENTFLISFLNFSKLKLLNKLLIYLPGLCVWLRV